jgi:hypothetical protein
MRHMTNKTALVAAILAAVTLAGCLIVSGTFIIVKTFSFTTRHSFYHYAVDITGEGDWKSHKDQIDNIDLVGFELWITSYEAIPTTFSVYLDSMRTTPYTTQSDVVANASKVLDGLTVNPGANHVSYGNSFKYLTNVEVMKRLVRAGTFDYYGTSTGGTSSGFIVDSAKVIVTFSASGS